MKNKISKTLVTLAGLTLGNNLYSQDIPEKKDSGSYIQQIVLDTIYDVKKNFNSYSQDLGCDTLYDEKGKIEQVICKAKDNSGNLALFISDFRDEKIFSKSKLGYKNNELVLYRRFKLDEKGRLVIKEDSNGDGYFDKVLVKNEKNNTIDIDNNNDGFFETISTNKIDRGQFSDFSIQQSSDKSYETPDTSMNYEAGVVSINEIEKSDYKGSLENIVLAFVDIQKEGEQKGTFMINLKSYNLSFNSELLPLILGARQEGVNFNPPVKLYLVKKISEGNVDVVPIIMPNGYNFKKDKPKKIKKEVENLLGNEKIYVSDPVKLWSAKMFFEIIGKEDKKDKKKKKKKK